MGRLIRRGHLSTVLMVHPGSELFGSDRMFLESVEGMLSSAPVVAVVPESGPLVDLLRDAGAEVRTAPMLVLRKALMRPSGWSRLARSLVIGAAAAIRIVREVRPAALYTNTVTIPLWPIVAWIFNIPSVTHVHEAEASGNRWINRVMYAPHLLARRVIVNSEFSRKTMVSALPLLSHRGTVIYNGVVGPEEPPAPRTTIDGALRVLFIGRLSPRKGPDVLIDACAEMVGQSTRPVVLTLVGASFEGYEWFEAELHARAGRAPAGLTVIFAGFRNDVWRQLSHCDLLVVPSTVDEPFGNTAVEGILALRPVIATDAGGLKEAAGGYETTKIVVAGDARKLSVALLACELDWQTLVASVGESRRTAQARHSPVAYRSAIVHTINAQAQAARRRRIGHRHR